MRITRNTRRIGATLAMTIVAAASLSAIAGPAHAETIYNIKAQHSGKALSSLHPEVAGHGLVWGGLGVLVLVVGGFRSG